jgi:hypothetical protein
MQVVEHSALRATCSSPSARVVDVRRAALAELWRLPVVDGGAPRPARFERAGRPREHTRTAAGGLRRRGYQ